LDKNLSKLHLGVEAKKSQIDPQTLGEKQQRKRPRKKKKNQGNGRKHIGNGRGTSHPISFYQRTIGLHRLSKNHALKGGNLEAQISESLAQIKRQKQNILPETNQIQTLEE
jgi:hypothetical protein